MSTNQTKDGVDFKYPMRLYFICGNNQVSKADAIIIDDRGIFAVEYSFCAELNSHHPIGQCYSTYENAAKAVRDAKRADKQKMAKNHNSDLITGS